MNRQRVQSIIIQDGKVLFGEGLSKDGCFVHYFIGGGVEEGESPEQAAIRELSEEANVEGKILFKIDGIVLDNHHTYLVDIGDQMPILGYDPEEEEQMKEQSAKALQKLRFISIDDDEKFTSIDIAYFVALVEECKKRGYRSSWNKVLEDTISRYMARDDWRPY